MEFARTSGLWGCKRLRSSESRRPRLREVVGQRPKAARHPVGEPENGRPQPGANASFVIFRQCVDPGEIYIYHHLPISLSTSLPTQLPTYLPIYPSIYLSLPSRGIGCSRPCPWPPGRPWSRGTASCPSYSTGPQRPSPGRQGLPSRTSVCAGPFVRQRRVPFRPAGASPGCPQETLRAILWRRLLLQEVCRSGVGLLLSEPQPHGVCRNSTVGVPWVILRHARRTSIFWFFL